MEYQESRYYYDGYTARQQGKSVEHNPHAIGYQHARGDWARGWRAAENDTRIRQATLEQDIKAMQAPKKPGAIESVDDYLNEIVATRAGCPVKRKDTLSLERVKLIRDIFPAIFSAGQDSAFRKFRKN